MLIIVKGEYELHCLNLSISVTQLAEAAETYLNEVGLDPGRSVDDPIPSAFAVGTEVHDDFWPDDDPPEAKFPMFIPWLVEGGHATMETDFMEIELS